MLISCIALISQKLLGTDLTISPFNVTLCIDEPQLEETEQPKIVLTYFSKIQFKNLFTLPMMRNQTLLCMYLQMLYDTLALT